MLATKESAEACFHAAESLNDNPSVNVPHQLVIEKYNATCREESLCVLDIDEGLKNSFLGADRNPAEITAVAQSHPVIMKGSMDFGGSFGDDPTIAEFGKACKNVGGTMGCVDGIMTLKGEVASMLAEGEADNGLIIDIDIDARSFPYCFPSECEGEDLTRVVEDAARDGIMNVPDIQNMLNPTTESLLNEVTFAQLCALSGLGTCLFTVTSSECEFSSSFGLNAGFALSVLVAASSSFIMFM